MKTARLTGILAVLALIMSVWAVVASLSVTPRANGSVDFSSAGYYSTTTSATFPNVYTLKNGGGTGLLGSVIITKTGTGAITLYDATTSNINLRAASMATSTIVIADFLASPTVGTYVYDTAVKYGILIVNSGSVASTTVTWK